LEDFSGLPSLAAYPETTKWFDKLIQRPGFKAGRNVPRPHLHIMLNCLGEDELDKVAEHGRKLQEEAKEKEPALRGERDAL